MTAIVHATFRKKASTNSMCGVNWLFLPNEKGDVVAEVSDDAARGFLRIQGFVLYEGEPDPQDLSPVLTEPPVAVESVEAESPYVLKDEAGVILLDLRTLDDDALRAFAEENNIKIHHACKGNTIRDKIVEALGATE